MEKKTRILAVGDVHGNKSLMERLAKRARDENIDIVILAGDLTFAETSVEGIVGPFAKENKQVLLIPGNHESNATVDFLEEKYSNAKNIHGNSFKKDNLGIFGAGGADFGIHIIPENEIFELLNNAHEEIKDSSKKIMVTHLHPKGTSSEISGFQGSESVRKAIETFQPDIAIHAHIHEASGLEDKIGNTRAVNVSRKEQIFEI